VTNSQALGTARTLRVRLESVQSRLDELPSRDHTTQVRSARTLTALCLTDAEELCQFLEELQQKTLNPGGTQP